MTLLSPTPTETALLDINTKLRGELAALKRRAETDEGNDEPAPKDKKNYKDTTGSGGDDDMEIGPDGKLRPKKKKVAADDPNDERDAPVPSGAWNEIPVSAKVFALAICNAGLKARGMKPLGRLVQDSTVLPADGVAPHDPEAFAKCCVDAARKARGQPPLEPNEFISRGGR
jgi:hypothetical protein